MTGLNPPPDLEGDIVEVSSDILKANIALVKQEPATPTEEEDKEDYRGRLSHFYLYFEQVFYIMD